MGKSALSAALNLLTMKTKTNPAQLELWKDYKAVVKDVASVLKRLGDALAKMVEAGELKPAEATQKIKEVEVFTAEQLREMRERFNRIVNNQALTKGIPWEEIYRIVYRRLYDLTHFNAQARALSAGPGVLKLDMVEKFGYLPKAIEIAGAL